MKSINKLLSCLIVDDESSGREILTELIKSFVPLIGQISTASSVKTGVESINNNIPDLVFLDVEMQDGTGFQVLEHFPNRKFEVVFVTAWQHYAIQAIKQEAMDYLLKPVNIEELQQAVERASVTIIQNRATAQQHESQSKIAQKPIRLTLPTINGLEIVQVEDIIYCKSEENYTRFFIRDSKSILVSKTIRTYEDSLETSGFFRIHKSHLVNLAEIRRYLHSNGGEVQMSDGSLLEVARTKKHTLLELL